MYRVCLVTFKLVSDEPVNTEFTNPHIACAKYVSHITELLNVRYSSVCLSSATKQFESTNYTGITT